MRAVFLDLATVDAGDLDAGALESVLPRLVLHRQTPQDDVAERISGCEVVLLNKSRITRAMIESNPQLRLIGLTATGVDNVDVAAAREHGVAVCNLRDYCTPSVVQHVFATLLALTHRLADYDAFTKGGHWARASQFSVFPYPIRELAGRTLGIVGYGALGRGVARAAAAFGLEVVVANRPGGTPEPGRVDLDELLPRADVLSLHCPLTPATRGLVGAGRLARMKPDAILINTARGALVDAAALASALRAGRLGGAAIDVLEQEPPVSGNPLLEPGIPNLIVTPHTAWAAHESRQRCLDELAANVEAFLRGERRNRVD
ncbi:MAG: D-2-hydroxyacid dehydrogenase [Steroidobacteraceae bacterium]|jgi:glycerate dehydrogenase|nr:D-2-hydroxyacid dehydrogenase [Steroidobacteraceae bacterium]